MTYNCDHCEYGRDALDNHGGLPRVSAASLWSSRWHHSLSLVEWGMQNRQGGAALWSNCDR